MEPDYCEWTILSLMSSGYSFANMPSLSEYLPGLLLTLYKSSVLILMAELNNKGFCVGVCDTPEITLNLSLLFT